jgi:hypothetical protein
VPLLLALTMALVMLLGGCGPRGPQGGEVRLDEMPSYAVLAARHNARVKLLERLYAHGVIEIRWRDDKGKHYEQGDVDIWLRMPNEVALQVTKMGERLFWLGANSEASWFFDLRKEGQRFAEIRGPTAVAAGDSDAPLTVSMATLLELMGLAEIQPENSGDGPDVMYDEDTDAWVLTTEGSAGRIRVFFDVERDLPVRVEVFEQAPGAGELREGVAIYSSLPLNSYEYIFIAGRAVDEFPRVPTRIDIFRADESGSLKISVSRPVSEDESFQEHYFDLDWLLAALQPTDVRDFRNADGGQR